MMQFYAPREMFAYAIGFIEQGRHNLDLARAAFDHALHQNGALYMGQVHLAEIAFAQGDTSAVIQDFETALRVQPRDVIVHTNYGSLLSLMGHRDAAVAQLDTAVRLDPDFATPYWLWAHVLDARGDTVAALQKYHEFLHHAPEEAVERPDAIVRILALTR
jgi:Tfp pilus assembly protein PilF